MATQNRFENLDVWKVSHALVLKIYKATSRFPKDERFRLGDQLRRSASSVPTNIVEGSSRAHKKEYLRFLDLSKSSLEETKYHLLLARDLGFLKEKLYTELHEDCNRIGRMLSGLIKHLRS